MNLNTDIELELAPAALPALLRLPDFAVDASPLPLRIVWHDTPDGQLLETGCTLAEQAGAWRLERLHPGDEPWLPAGPAPVLAEADSAAALLDGISPVPAAALEGRVHTLRSRHRHQNSGTGHSGCGTLRAVHGTLRGVAREASFCRLILSGNAAEMAALLHQLSALPVRVPRAALSAVALGLARGQSPAPRHLGGPQIGKGMSLADGFTQSAGALADVILYWADQVPDSTDPEAIHQMRVAVRRMRSLLAVFKPVLAPDACASLAGRLRDIGHHLGVVRDWDVFLGGTAVALRATWPDDSRVSALLEACQRRQQTLKTNLRQYMASEQFRLLELYLVAFVHLRPWLSEEHAATLHAPASAFAVKMLRRLHRKLLRQGAHLLDLPPEAQHDVRKKAKRLRYVAEFFAPLFPSKATRRMIRQANALQDILGEVNDAHTNAALMAQLGARGQSFAAGLAQGYGAHIAYHAHDHIAERWVEFQETTPFWT